MRRRYLFCLLALPPLAACTPDPSQGSIVSPANSAARAQNVAPSASLAFGVNGTKVGTPVALKLPPVLECADWATCASHPGIGDAAALFNVSEAESLLDWMESIGRREPVDVEARVAAVDGTLRRILHRRTLISRLELGTSLRVQWTPQAVKDPGGPQSIEGVKLRPSVLAVSYPILKEYPVLAATTPVVRPEILEGKDPNTRLPLLHYGSIEFDDIRLEIDAAGYKSAEALAADIIADGTLEESEFSDVEVDAKEGAAPVARLQVSVAPICVTLSDDGKTAVLRLVVRGVRITTALGRARLGPITVKLRPC